MRAVDAGAERVAERAGGTGLCADQVEAYLARLEVGSGVAEADELFGKHVQEEVLVHTLFKG